MKFGQLLKKARTGNKKTLREVATASGLSISLLSDIEHGRRSVSSLEVLRKIEKFLNVIDGSLTRAAQKEKTLEVPPDARELFWKRGPELSMALLRASTDLSEKDIHRLIANMQKKSQRE